VAKISVNRTPAVVSGVSAFLDGQAAFPLAGGFAEWRNSVENCGGDPLKQQLRLEYVTSTNKKKKVPSCNNFVNAFPTAVSSPPYPFVSGVFGSNARKHTWLEDDQYEWALVSPAIVVAVNVVMQQYGENRGLNSGYRNPSLSNQRYPQYGGWEPHSQGLAADFTVRDANGAINKTIFDALHDDAKSSDTATALKPYGMVACVEPWELVSAPNSTAHFHLDVVSTATCAETHDKRW
jgi:hypothetical protein